MGKKSSSRNPVANFHVDPRIASVLGESYRSVEEAIKELVDNAWDAEASNVWLIIPDVMHDSPIIITDDGSGMTPNEVKQDYLNIANSRAARKGKKTPFKGRKVKGRKGIGKFAGLVTAGLMTIETKSRGKSTHIVIERDKLLQFKGDIGKIDLPFSSEDCGNEEHGTIVALSHFDQRLRPPCTEKLSGILLRDYGRETNFQIYINAKRLERHRLPGKKFEHIIDIPEIGVVSVNFIITEDPQPAKNTGFAIRVGGKVIGQTEFFGLDEMDDIPKKFRNRIIGEIEADGLEKDVTADWGAIIENSNAFQAVKDVVGDYVRKNIQESLSEELKQNKNILEASFNDRIQHLPPPRRDLARQAFERIILKFYGEAQDKLEVVVSLMLDALERDEYWLIVQKINEARHSGVAIFAEALEYFGLVEMSLMSRQATKRLEFLDWLDELERQPETLEIQMHSALESNLWVFGPEYSLMSSNKTLKTTIEDYTNKNYTGKRASKRPDLFLVKNVLNKHVLIEFKRPTATIGRDAEAQVKKYRDDLTPYYGKIDVIIIGGKKDPTMNAFYEHSDTLFWSYKDVISSARTQLEWLIKELIINDGRFIAD